MQKKRLIQNENQIFRVLEVKDDRVFVIDCIKKTMPKWRDVSVFSEYGECSLEELLEKTNVILCDEESLNTEERRFIREHFTLIAPILPFVSNEKQRSYVIDQIAKEENISKQTIRAYLCLYLVYQNTIVFAPKPREKRELTLDEKNMRWALNKFFYTKNKNSLTVAYTMMLQTKYCDGSGILLPKYPTLRQFRYFEQKYRKQQNFYISRDGIKSYQRNNRALLGDGVQEFAPNIGTAMLDSTICDIYLVNEVGHLVGRPILTACIDTYSSMCCGYSLSWEGGTYSLRGLMANVIADKVEHCKKHGISIQKSEWDCDKIPAILVTDMGTEYKSENFEQLVELGVKIINLPAYRPELKGSVEKFFDLIQGYFKPYLKGKGIIETDFQERGSHDYRKDACLTLKQFEKIILHCILYYNCKRVLESFPYTDGMIEEKIEPYACEIWNYGKKQAEANLIFTSYEELILVLLPRTTGKFNRFGLNVNGMRYKHDNYTEMFLKGGEVVVVYNPECINDVWLIEKGEYIRFTLIESRFKDKDLIEAQKLVEKQKILVKSVRDIQTQATIDLANHIQTVVENSSVERAVDIKEVRNTRKKEKLRNRVDFVREGGNHVGN